MSVEPITVVISHVPWPTEVGKKVSLDVLCTTDGRRVGTITLRSAASKNVYIEWRLEPEEQGKGYMSQAVTALLNSGIFDVYHRVVAVIRPNNVRSSNLARRVGFRFEGTAVDARFDYGTGTWESMEFWAMLGKDLE